VSVQVANKIIHLEGRCRIEEAETLIGHLLEDPDRLVDLSACEALHSAIVQILMATRPGIVGEPVDPFLCAHVLPLLDAKRSPSGPVPL
jgi:hypothetical protein